MRLNSKHTAEDLEQYIQMYLKDGISYQELREKFGLLLNQSIFTQKVLRYQSHGPRGIQTKSRNNSYSDNFKQCVIREYIEEGIPIKQLARKYNIPSPETVRRWIIRYTEGEEIRSYSPKPEVYTMKSRKTA